MSDLGNAIIEDMMEAKCGHRVDCLDICDGCGQCLGCCDCEPVQTYQLLQRTEWLFTYNGVVLLMPGELCKYFKHSDTYLFKARSNVVPFFSRLYVKNHPELFEPVNEGGT